MMSGTVWRKHGLQPIAWSATWLDDPDLRKKAADIYWVVYENRRRWAVFR